ncbi:hypothetical protein EBQ93_01500 [bacterium]|nr:hypothetical protein [bacterium]
MTISPSTLERLRSAIWPTIEMRYELPKGILRAIAEWETRGTWRNDQVGPTGAKGIFQLTPIALEQVRQDSGGVRFDPINPVSASVAAGILLKRYLTLFNDIPLAVAAYNAGEGTVRRFVQSVRQKGSGFLPRETVEYIPAVLTRLG